MPLGTPVKNSVFVEIMHFPPNYTMTNDIDYYAAATLKRWADLLTRNQLPQSTLKRSIMDVLPIAAPADSGTELEKDKLIYADFLDYDNKILAVYQKYQV